MGHSPFSGRPLRAKRQQLANSPPSYGEVRRLSLPSILTININWEYALGALGTLIVLGDLMKQNTE
jgi:hypothetical protein